MNWIRMMKQYRVETSRVVNTRFGEDKELTKWLLLMKDRNIDDERWVWFYLGIQLSNDITKADRFETEEKAEEYIKETLKLSWSQFSIRKVYNNNQIDQQ